MVNFPIRSEKRKIVQVVECPRFERKAKVDDKVEETEHEVSLKMQIKKQYHDTMDEIHAFASEHVDSKSKKVYQQEKIQKLGGKAKKQHSIPLKIQTGLRKKRKEKDIQFAKMEKQTKVVQGKYQIPVNKRQKYIKQKAKKDFGIQATVGKFKQGVLKV